MQNNYWLALVLFSITNCFSQIGGKSVYEFLNLVSSSRQAALGGKTVTIYDNDVNQVNFNPATLNDEMHKNLAVNYGNYYGEIAYGTAAYAYTYDRHLKTFAAGVNYINYGSFDGYDENGTATDTFSGSEVAIYLSYAFNIPNSDWHIGSNLKMISSRLESYSSMGVGVDIGAIYIDHQNDINWALVIRNLGTQITYYSETHERFPLEIIAGVSQQLEHVPIRWHLTLENLQQWNIAFSNPNQSNTSIDGATTEQKVSFFNNAMRHMILGVELFPEKGFNIRLGYNFRRSQELKILELRNFAGFSVGAGLKINKLKFNYSYSKYSLAANTSLLGLTIDLK
jgi:hypothetical protein